jgi:hypothetical protein
MRTGCDPEAIRLHVQDVVATTLALNKLNGRSLTLVLVTNIEEINSTLVSKTEPEAPTFCMDTIRESFSVEEICVAFAWHRYARQRNTICCRIADVIDCTQRAPLIGRGNPLSLTIQHTQQPDCLVGHWMQFIRCNQHIGHSITFKLVFQVGILFHERYLFHGTDNSDGQKVCLGWVGNDKPNRHSLVL